jgi:ketosteroid isomerase-like protein
MSSTEDNKKAVAEFLEVFSTGNVAEILNRMHDDATWWVSGALEGMSGSYDKAAFGRLIGGVKDVYKTGALQITPVLMTAEDNRVAVETQSYAELKDGRVYKPSCHFLFVLADDGRILQVKEYLDTKHAYDIFFAG